MPQSHTQQPLGMCCQNPVRCWPENSLHLKNPFWVVPVWSKKLWNSQSWCILVGALYSMKKHNVADRISQQFSEFLSNRPHHHTFFCRLTRFCPHCCCSSIYSSDSALPLDGWPKVEILLPVSWNLPTHWYFHICTLYLPLLISREGCLILVILAVSKMGTLHQLTNAAVDMYASKH